ncbi:major facilitator superfamily domain-containing protein [Aspergillus alliaceus]|uniref:major facilitator superfamily domain-containing protein n=1 Tax=Petromyces alliaceus TaxID=209559 RepID=UPI0012A4976D|nr:major facilitator superfamily domain-containing protein [Aspergillus alliaceus]KAB8229706.1 major facilitator superfamily domain-containing protein [Aspergillus alliaceus]
MAISGYSLLASTCSFAGLQVIWAIYFAHGTAHLLSLGFSKPASALTLMAGPVCGVIVQPYIGALSDTYRSSWGRRRPFIIYGSMGVSICINLLASLVHAHSSLMRWFQLEPTAATLVVKVFAALLVYALNISFQPVQNGLRALMVEAHCAHEQTWVNIWTSYMIGAGNIIGYFMGIPLGVKTLNWPPITGFQALCILGSIILMLTTFVSCAFTKEYSESPGTELCPREGHPLSPLKYIFEELRALPDPIRRVCRVQFVAWFGWFPFLHFQTLYVNEVYTGGALNTETRVEIGSLAGLLCALVSLVSSAIIPTFLDRTAQGGNEKGSGKQRLPKIVMIWRFGHIFFAAGMFSTTIVTNWIQAATLVALIGIPWSISSIVPYTMIGAEIATRRDLETIAEAESSELPLGQAGSIMSIHNVAISAPQILAAVMSSGVFWLCYLLGLPESTLTMDIRHISL